MVLTKQQSKDTPDYEIRFPVTLSFSGRVKDQESVRKNIFDALVSWVNDGPGFVSEYDDCYTTGITVQCKIEL